MSQSGLTHELGHPVSVELPRIPVTKTKPPAVRKFAVERPRLLDVLDAASERPVTYPYWHQRRTFTERNPPPV